MSEREPLEQLRASLQRGNFIDLLGGDTRHAGRKYLDLYLSNTASTGRSEVPVLPEQLPPLLGKVDQISKWLSENGRSGSDYPNYQIRIEDELNTPEELEHMYYYEKGPFEASTYLVGIEEPKLRLFKNLQDKRTLICIDFLWNNRFELEVQFGEVCRADEPTPSDEVPAEIERFIIKEHWEEAQRQLRECEEKMREEGKILERLQDYYYSAERPVSEMNQEECDLITQCLDEFMLQEGLLPTAEPFLSLLQLRQDC